MKKQKLSIEKFTISKLNNYNSIFGGGTTRTQGTDTATGEGKQCVLGSLMEIVPPDKTTDEGL